MRMNWKGIGGIAKAMVAGAIAVLEKFTDIPSNFVLSVLQEESAASGPFHDRVQTFIIIIFTVLALVILAWPIIRKQIFIENRYSDRFFELSNRWEKLGVRRNEFWDYLKETYGYWAAGKDSYPASFDELVDNATFPTDIPTGASGNLAGLTTKIANDWTAASVRLWDFCQSVYGPGGVLKDVQKSKEEPFRRFHIARQQLANHWNEVGFCIYKAKNVAEEDILERHFPHQTRLLKLLAYLELSLAISLQTKNLSSKEGLVELYENAETKGRTN